MTLDARRGARHLRARMPPVSERSRSTAAPIVATAVGLALFALVAPLVTSSSSPAVAPAPPLPPLDTVVRGDGPWTVVVLHGYGAAGDDLVPLADALLARAPARYVIPAAPRPMPDGVGRMWFPAGGAASADEVLGARERVDALIDAELARGTPEDHVVVGGFSQGGILSIATALAARHRVGGIFVLSGRSPPHAPDAASHLAALPVFQSHGRDDARIPFADGEAFATEARAAGADLTFVPFAGPHAIPPLVERALGEWLAERTAAR